MRYLSIGFPSNVQVVSQGQDGTHTRFTNDDGAEFGVEIVEGGEGLEPENKLYIETSRGNVSGFHRVRERKSDSLAMPDIFSKGLGVRYNYGHVLGEPGMLDMIGQSTKGVKEYYPVKLFNPDGTSVLSNHSFERSQIISYRGSLYIFAETRTPIPRSTHVRIYKSVNGTDFFYHYEFTRQPRPTMEGARSGIDTGGSVTVTEHNGDLIAAYRRIVDDKVYVSVFKSTDDDVLDWVEISTIEILNTSIETNSFKLKIASGGGVLMLVYCSNSSIELSTVPPEFLNKPEFRYYISHDGGDTFVDPEEIFQKSMPNNGRGGGDRITSLVSFFKDSEATPLSSSNHIGQEPISTGFDLYFDKDMGAFVILKASDSDRREDTQWRRGDNKLIGIKTVAGDVYEWEKCLELRMDYNINGILTNYREVLYQDEDSWNRGTGDDNFNPFRQPIETSDDGKPRGYGGWLGYVVTDVTVVPGETKNDIILNVSQNVNYKPGVETGIAIGEFRFVDEGLRAEGGAKIGYGVASHEDYSFVSTLLNHRLSGLVHRGVPSSISESEPGVNPYFSSSRRVTATRHRGVLLVQLAEDTSYGARLGPLSNIGETKGYELSYPGAEGRITTIGAVLQGSAVQRSDHVECTVGPTAGFSPSYMTIDERQFNHTVTNYPYRSILRYIGLTLEKFIKVKFKVKMSNSVNLSDAGEVVFFDMLISGDKQTPFTDMRVRLTAEKVAGVSGRYVHVFYGDAMTYIGTVSDLEGNEAILNLGRETEFLLAHVPIVPTDYERSGLFLFHRSSASSNWEIGLVADSPLEEVSPSKPLADRTSHISIGFISRQTPYNFSDSIHVSDLAVSSLGAGARGIYTAVRNLNDRFEVEPFAKIKLIEEGNTSERYLANPIQLFNRQLPISDSSLVQLTGGNIETSKTSLFQLRGQGFRNPEECVIDGIADSAYDFTERWVKDPEFEIVFKSADETYSDALTLVNLNGVVSVTVRAGYWNATAKEWIGHNVKTYHVPMIPVTVEAADGRTVLFSGSDFEPGQVIGYSFFSYNPETQGWENSRLIVDNVGDILKLDRPIQGMGVVSNKKFFIAKNIMSFDISDVSYFYDYAPIHYGISFNSADNATFRAVGEINFGRWIDLSSHVIESSSKTKDNAGLISSEFGNLYPSLVKKGNIINEIDLDFTYLQTHNGEASSVKEMMLSLKRTRKAFPLVEYHTDGQKVQYVSISGDVKSSAEGHGEKLSTVLTSQAWYPRPEYPEDVNDYSFSVTVTPNLPILPGPPVLFRITFDDPLVSIGQNKVVWSLDEGVEVVNQDNTVSYNYQSTGGKVITIRIVRPDGSVLAFKRFSLSVGVA